MLMLFHTLFSLFFLLGGGFSGSSFSKKSQDMGGGGGKVMGVESGYNFYLFLLCFQLFLKIFFFPE
jgi:hypothetical protein